MQILILLAFLEGLADAIPIEDLPEAEKRLKNAALGNARRVA